MQFRSLLKFSLILLNTGHLAPVSQNEQYVPVILGKSKDISFVECTSTIKKEGGVDIEMLQSLKYSGRVRQLISFSFYKVSEDELICVLYLGDKEVCHIEVSREQAALTTRTYLINTLKSFQYSCEAKLSFTTGEIKVYSHEKNITDDERFASSGIRCQGHGWCNNQPGSATYSSDKRCCNSAVCDASRSGGWHVPVCCFYIARKQVPSDFTTQMVVTKQTYFLALSLLVVFTVCSVILGILQMIAMVQRIQRKMREARKRRTLKDLKAVEELRNLLTDKEVFKI